MSQPVLALVIAPGCEPYELRYDVNDYTQTQALVGGITTSTRLTDDVTLLSHDEGLLIGLPPNFRTPDATLFVGTVVAVQDDVEGDSINLSRANITLVRDWLKRCQTNLIRYDYDIPEPIIAFGPDWNNVRAEVAAKVATRPPVRLAYLTHPERSTPPPLLR
jgi:hypothetical protein